MHMQKRLRHRCDESELAKLYHAVSPWQLTYDVATDIRRARWHLTWQLLYDKAADIRRNSWHITWHLLYDVAADIRRGYWHRKWNDTNVHVADSLQSEVVFKIKVLCFRSQSRQKGWLTDWHILESSHVLCIPGQKSANNHYTYIHWENCLHFVYAPRCVSFFTHPTALMHFKKWMLRKCIELHFIFLAPTRMRSHWELL